MLRTLNTLKYRRAILGGSGTSYRMANLTDFSDVRARSISPGSPPNKKARLEISREAPFPSVDSTAAVNADAASTSVLKNMDSTKPKRKSKARKPPPPEPGSSEDVNLHDIMALLGSSAVEEAARSGMEYMAPIPLYEEIELVVSELSSNGESMSLLPSPHPPWVVMVPFALPGETIRARVYRHGKMHSYGDLISVITPNNALRDDSRVKCKYFGTCGGCQYQMLSYETQLELKKRVVEKAYESFSGLESIFVPSVLPTIASPKQYGYRTKITPHFDVPPKSGAKSKDWEVRIGFDQKGRRSVMDIEECPIATEVLNQELPAARDEVKRAISSYKRGATLLLRDSLVIPPKDPATPNQDATTSNGKPATATNHDEQHICITSHKAQVRERVGTTLFEFPAGSFFQNNNSILEPLTSYVREAIFSPPLLINAAVEGVAVPDSQSPRTPTHLVDTYCGSGLFSLTLSPYFTHIAGIEIDAASIRAAKHNLALNGLPESKHAFHTGKSEDIFASVLSSSSGTFPPQDTVVVIDPPRKGCDESFIDQVVKFGPAVLVYVSCNVHTQARDVGMLLRKTEARGEGAKYVLECLRGFDLFPQTAHVESVAVLRRR